MFISKPLNLQVWKMFKVNRFRAQGFRGLGLFKGCGKESLERSCYLGLSLKRYKGSLMQGSLCGC